MLGSNGAGGIPRYELLPELPPEGPSAKQSYCGRNNNRAQAATGTGLFMILVWLFATR